MDEFYPQFNTQKNDTEGSNPPVYEQPGVTGNSQINYVTFIPYGFTPKTYEEKNGIKKKAMSVGLSLIITMGITFVWSIVPFIVIFKAGGMRISDLAPIKKPEKGMRLSMYFIGVAFCAFANMATSAASRFFSFFGIEYNVDFGETPKGFFGFLLCLLSTVITPALIEEFAFRGIVLGSLKKYGEGFAVLVSSILFGLMHGNFEQIPFAFLVGLVLGLITVKTDSILIACAVHGTNNLVSVIFDFIPSGISQAAQNIMYLIFLLICLTLGILALSLSEKSNEMFKLKKDSCESKLKERFKWFFTSPVIIIFIVICIFESLAYF